MRPFPLYRPASFRLADWLTARLPAAVPRTLARGVTEAAYWLAPNFRRNVQENLGHLFPDDPSRVRSLARQTFHNYGLQLMEYSQCAHMADGGLLRMAAAVVGTQHVDRALQRGKGAIVITAHFGNWELGGLLFAQQGYPLNAITLEEHIDRLTEMREQYRTRHGIRTIRIGRSPFSFIDVMDALRRNEIVAMLIERPVPSAAVDVEFFGEPAPFSSGPVILAMATEATILPAFVWRESDGRYHAEITEPVELDLLTDRENTIRHNTQKIARVFEAVIREHPDQWYNFVPIWRKP
jgi:KDO2-lipid IV(A) lauroyltransferase